MSKTLAVLPRLSDYPEHYARLTPNNQAAVLGNITLDYRRFARRIDQCASAMLQAGLGHGDRVATLSNPHPDALVIFMACARIGAIWLGLNTRSKYDELAYIVGDAQPSLLFTIADFEGRDYGEDIANLSGKFGCIKSTILLTDVSKSAATWTEPFSNFDTFLQQGGDYSIKAMIDAVAAVKPDAPALIVYTSGSTGQPKGALLSHRNIVTSALTQYHYWHPEPLRILNNAPINHLGGAVQIAAYGIVTGGTNVLMERFKPADTLAVIEAQQITVAHQTPTMFQLILDKADPAQYDLSSLQLLIWSGSAAPRDLLVQLRTLCPHLSTSYGQTECGAEVLYVPVDADEEILATSVGTPPDNMQVRLANGENQPVAPGETGEIQVKSPTVMLGYWQRPEATKEAFTDDGWLHTGDLAKQDEQGNYRIVGRLKEMYKSGGYNIYPREIEIQLERHPAVAIAAVVSVPDPLFSEVGHAFVLLEDQQTISEQDLKDFCHDKLANYKVPKKITVSDQLPMLPIGKVDKVKLKKCAIKQAQRKTVAPINC